MPQSETFECASDGHDVLERCAGVVFDQDVGPLFGQVVALLRAPDATTETMYADGISAALDAQSSALTTAGAAGATRAAMRRPSGQSRRVAVAMPATA